MHVVSNVVTDFGIGMQEQYRMCYAAVRDELADILQQSNNGDD